MRERAQKREEDEIERGREKLRSAKTYTKGETRKNVGLMLDALGAEIRRNMLLRLRGEGAMSLSKLIEPFGFTLPTAQGHLKILEQAGLVKTHKRGRIRFCVYNPDAVKELSEWFSKAVRRSRD